MKTLTGLNEKLQALNDEEKQENIPTFKRVYRILLGNSLATSGEDAIEMMQLGLKLRQDETSIKVEDAEFKLLKSVAERNEPRYVAHILAQILIRLKADEERKE